MRFRAPLNDQRTVWGIMCGRRHKLVHVRAICRPQFAKCALRN